MYFDQVIIRQCECCSIVNEEWTNDWYSKGRENSGCVCVSRFSQSESSFSVSLKYAWVVRIAIIFLLTKSSFGWCFCTILFYCSQRPGVKGKYRSCVRRNLTKCKTNNVSWVLLCVQSAIAIILAMYSSVRKWAKFR